MNTATQKPSVESPQASLTCAGPVNFPPADEDWPVVPSVLYEVVTGLGQYHDRLDQSVLRDLRIRDTQPLMGFGWPVLVPRLVTTAGAFVRFAKDRIWPPCAARCEAFPAVPAG